MKTKMLLTVLAIGFSCTILAQTTLLPVYEIKADTPVEKIPDAYWQMQVDSTGNWTIKDVTTPQVSDRFHSNNTKQTGFGFSNTRHYWQRLRLKNNTGKELKLVFSNRPSTDRFDMYIYRTAGKPEHLVNGLSVPWDKRDALKGGYSVTVNLSPDEEVIIYKKLYLRRVDPSNELFIGYNIFDRFVQENYIDAPWFRGDVRNWFIAGLLIFGFFIILFFFLIVREKIYLYMALLLLTEGLWYLLQEWDVALRNHLVFKGYLLFFVTHLVFFFSVTQFVRYFLKTPTYYPRWDKILMVLFALMAISATIINGLDYSNYFPVSWKWIPQFLTGMFFAMLMFSLLLSFVFFKKEKDKLTNLAVVAATPAFLLWSFGYGMREVYSFIVRRYEKTPPAFIEWYWNNEVVIEMFCVAWFAILFTWILLQRYALLRKQYTQQALDREKERSELMEQQKIELEKQVEERTAELKHSLEELKNTQRQLIHAEKMASLGELTAGIAHEIQNPLNFVNNFSEVNQELVIELNNELSNGNLQDAIALANDIKENELKINYHGKRADDIVKGMLQHSRASTGKKEPTDINALADEYLRLSYHGLRAKDKTFNAFTNTQFDESIESISVIPQDIGRVLLNLYTNAFYSVTEKKKQLNGAYEPTVSVTTKKLNDKVEISVKDNGTGIPQKVLDKIYQPFFTTKPAGEGTGLGLSMSYDIIKAHGGDMQVETKEGEGAEFIITLPHHENALT